MRHILVLYAPEDHEFARQVAVQIEQRGLVVWPVPDLTQLAPLPADTPQSHDDASHLLIVLSSRSRATAQSDAPPWQVHLGPSRNVFVVIQDGCPVPDALQDYPAVNFKGHFLMAIEEVVHLLNKTNAPTRPLTVENPPPVVKLDLLPATMPAERCWREDRLRINYSLPIILTGDDLELRLPAFLVAFNFELVKSSSKLVRARRNNRYPWFDPRRAEHTITVKRRSGGLRVYYRMTRMQVYYWFPAHYRVLDREAAALYRYLVTGKVEALRDPVDLQARLARVVSWGAILMFWIVVVTLAALVLT
jgi:hypothetical protein